MKNGVLRSLVKGRNRFRPLRELRDCVLQFFYRIIALGQKAELHRAIGRSITNPVHERIVNLTTSARGPFSRECLDAFEESISG